MATRSIDMGVFARWLLHLACVLALMWPAIVNRQPFFFSDTTAYVRAADLAVQIATHGKVRTAWSRPPPTGDAPRPASAATRSSARGSDGGAVMAGRSPYFGALLYIGYVSSDFWLFVLAQAIAAYWLIGLALRCFGLDRPRMRTAATMLLAVFTPLGFYCSLLLADALAGFGILAFLILATSRRRLSRGETILLTTLLVTSILAHLTHIVMLLAMVALLGLLALARYRPWTQVRWAVLTGIAVVVIGLASVTLTSRVVRMTLGKPPALVPLMTARFIVDGPGRDFIAAGCDGGRFIACRLPFTGEGSTEWLWSREPGKGVFLPADGATRARLSAEDTAFAIAVLKAYPARQGGMMLWNTGLQLATFDSAIMAEGCFVRLDCNADALPPRIRAQVAASLSGRDLWPTGLIAAKDYAGVIAALLLIAVLLPRMWRADPEAARRLALWLGLFGIAMLANAFLGGAVSEPQGRYQARIIWILPLAGIVAWARWRALRHGIARPAAVALPVRTVSG